MRLPLLTIIATAAALKQAQPAHYARDAQEAAQPPAMVGELTAEPVLKLGFDNALAETDPVPEKFLLTLNILQIAVSNSFRSMRMFFAATQLDTNHISNEAHGFLSTLRWCAASVESIECIPERHVESILFSIELLLSNVVQKVLSQILLKESLYDIAEVVVPQTVDAVNRITSHLADLQNRGLSDMTMSDIYQVNKALDEIATQVVVYNEWFERNEEDENTSEYIEPALFPVVPQPHDPKSGAFNYLNRTDILSIQTVANASPTLKSSVRAAVVTSTAIAAIKQSSAANQVSGSMGASLQKGNQKAVLDTHKTNLSRSSALSLSTSTLASSTPVSSLVATEIGLSVNAYASPMSIKSINAAVTKKDLETSKATSSLSIAPTTTSLTMKSSSNKTAAVPTSTKSSKAAIEVPPIGNKKIASLTQNLAVSDDSSLANVAVSNNSTLGLIVSRSTHASSTVVEVHPTGAPNSTHISPGDPIATKNGAKGLCIYKHMAVWPLVGLLLL